MRKKFKPPVKAPESPEESPCSSYTGSASKLDLDKRRFDAPQAGEIGSKQLFHGEFGAGTKNLVIDHSDRFKWDVKEFMHEKKEQEEEEDDSGMQDYMEMLKRNRGVAKNTGFADISLNQQNSSDEEEDLT